MNKKYEVPESEVIKMRVEDNFLATGVVPVSPGEEEDVDDEQQS